MMQDRLRRLAEVEPGELPVLSIYLDVRPEATGANPEVRSGMTVLRQRFLDLEQALGPRGLDLESFQADKAKIEAFLENEFPKEANGLAIFACSGRGLWEVIEAGVPFENQVTIGPAPDLYQLARLADEQRTAIVAVVDTNTARLYVTRSGYLEHIADADDQATHYKRTKVGGWSQQRYARHVDKHREKFAEEVASALEELARREKPDHVILAGNEVAIPHLEDELTKHVKDLLHDEVLRINIRAPEGEVSAEVGPILKQLEKEEEQAAADRLIEMIRADGLGAGGLDRTKRALENGQVDTLLLSGSAPIDDETRSELVRSAATIGAHVEIVENHEGLDRIGGVGALLRYRYDFDLAKAEEGQR